MNPILAALMAKAGMGGQPQNGMMPQPQASGPLPDRAIGTPVGPQIMGNPGMGGTQPPGALAAPAPAPSPQVPLPNGPGAVTPLAPTNSGQGSPSFNPSMTGAEPTRLPSKGSPPNAQFARNRLGALLLPQTIQNTQQKFGIGGQQRPGGAFGF